MRITIVTIGTRGDVQPYIALGLGLQRAGHAVRIATHAHSAGLVATYGLDFASIYQRPNGVLLTNGAANWFESGRHGLKVIGEWAHHAEYWLAHTLSDCLTACQDTDVIISGVLAAPFAFQVAEKLGRPCYPAYYLNVIRTRAHPSSLSPIFPASTTYNWFSYALIDDLAWLVTRPFYNAARRAVLQLPPLPPDQPLTWMWRQRQPHLVGVSPVVLSGAPEWGDWVHLTGYWFLDRPSSWQPPAGLVDFIDSGPAPVYVGFGSMPHRDPEQTTHLILKALALSGQRGVLAAGWGGLGRIPLPDNVFGIDEAPHDWLFPQMRAVVHHGGAGTTGAGLRAGVPSVLVPFAYDQPFWANRVYQMGVGPRPITRTALTPERLAVAIQAAVNDPRLRERASALGRQVRSEDGVAQAVEIFHRHPAAVPAPLGRRDLQSTILRTAESPRGIVQ